MRTCNAESQKRPAKGSNFKEDDSALLVWLISLWPYISYLLVYDRIYRTCTFYIFFPAFRGSGGGGGSEGNQTCKPRKWSDSFKNSLLQYLNLYSSFMRTRVLGAVGVRPLPGASGQHWHRQHLTRQLEGLRVSIFYVLYIYTAKNPRKAHTVKKPRNFFLSGFVAFLLGWVDLK